jgi:hypothetical protein
MSIRCAEETLERRLVSVRVHEYVTIGLVSDLIDRRLDKNDFIETDVSSKLIYIVFVLENRCEGGWV